MVIIGARFFVKAGFANIRINNGQFSTDIKRSLAKHRYMRLSIIRGFIFPSSILRNTACVYTRNYSLVVGAVDGDGELVGGAVFGGDGEVVGELVAMSQALHRRLLVVEAVAPRAVGLDGEAAMGGTHMRLRHELILTGVGIGDGELTAGVKRRLLGDRPGGGAADLGLVVGAVDGDGELVGGAVDGGDGETVGELVTMGQALHRRLLVVEAVAP